jgi:hypothetical protein
MRELDNQITSRAPLERVHPLINELPKSCVAVLHAPARPISTFVHQIGQELPTGMSGRQKSQF